MASHPRARLNGDHARPCAQENFGRLTRAGTDLQDRAPTTECAVASEKVEDLSRMNTPPP